jgi:ribonuclease-3
MPEKALPILGYLFKDASLLREALTHASSADHRLRSNERMEFLGDAILGYVVCEYLFEQYPELQEGELTKIKSAVVSRRVCAKISKSIKLSDLLNLGKGMSGRSSLPSSVAAAALESIIAAIYLDGGMEPTRRFILDHLVPYIEDAAASTHQQNFKSVLQQLTQRHLPITPMYVLLDEKGPDHAKAFQVCIALGDRQFSAAWAQSKKEAEQQAALNALLELGLVRRAEDQTILMVEEGGDSQAMQSLIAEIGQEV